MMYTPLAWSATAIDKMMKIKKTQDWLRVKLLRWGSRCEVEQPHTLRRPSRYTMARVIGTIGRGGAAAVRCH